MRIVSVVGTRPQLIKAAALWPVLRERHEPWFVDTGQHYDQTLAGAFFAELGLPRPDVSLGVGGGTHADQTGRMLRGLEDVLRAERPDAVLVYGDTNSTLAGALAAAKAVVPVAHVEAGLRSFDRTMPEEVNRIVADHLSRWLFAPTPAAVENLRAEGVTRGVELVGDLMQDLASRVSAEVRDPTAIPIEGLEAGRYLFATVHRQENRTSAAIAAWTALLARVARPDRPVALALHPGTLTAMERDRASPGANVRVTEPLGYRASLALQLHAAAVLTDSGGVQRESGWLGVPCLVLRSSTEWVETLAMSGGRMAVIGLDAERAVNELERLAPMDRAAEMAAARAASLALEPAGAARAISETLAR